MIRQKIFLSSNMLLLLFISLIAYKATLTGSTTTQDAVHSTRADHSTAAPHPSTEAQHQQTAAPRVAIAAQHQQTAAQHQQTAAPRVAIAAQHQQTAAPRVAIAAQPQIIERHVTASHHGSTRGRNKPGNKYPSYEDNRYKNQGNRYNDDNDGYYNNDRQNNRYDNNNKNNGYKNNQKQNNNNGYNNDDDDYIIGYNGIDPSPYGQDVADNKPIHSTQDSMLESLNIFITEIDDWEQKKNPKYRKQGGGKNYNQKKEYKNKGNKGKNYKDNDDDYKSDGYRKKRSYEKVRFPVRHYPDYRRFPIRRFPPLISIFPWLPIFYDKVTYQTFMFSPTGGMYVIPPLINFYGQRFAVAQLIKWGYASLVSTGAPPPPNVNIAPLVQPAPPPPVAVVPPVASVPVVDGPAPGSRAPKDPFMEGVKTDFASFKPRNSYGYDEDRNYQSSNRNNYGSDPKYGGQENNRNYQTLNQNSYGSGGQADNRNYQAPNQNNYVPNSNNGGQGQRQAPNQNNYVPNSNNGGQGQRQAPNQGGTGYGY